MRTPEQTHVPPGGPSTSGRPFSPERDHVDYNPMPPSASLPPHIIPGTSISQRLYYKKNDQYLPIEQNSETVIVENYTVGLLENNVCIPMYTENKKIAVIDNRTRTVLEVTEEQAASLGIGERLMPQKNLSKKKRINKHRPFEFKPRK